MSILTLMSTPAALTLTHTQSGTFQAQTVTNSGSLLIWDWGDGSAPDIANRPSHSYASAGPWVITIYSPDRFAGLTAFHCYSLNLTGITGLALLTGMLDFRVYSNASLTFDIAQLKDWRPTNFYVYSTSVSGDIVQLKDWRPTFFNVGSTSISGDIAQLKDWRPTGFYVNSTPITCSGAGAGDMAQNANLANWRVDSCQIADTGLNAIVNDFWTNRVNGAGLTLHIGSNPGTLTADSIAKIEGTGAYAGDGIKTYGASVTY